MNSRRCVLGGYLGFALLAGCQIESRPVPVTPAVVRAGAAQHHNERTLREGRALFVSRCIECHTLPAVQKYTAAAWPHLVDKMAKRADLKPTERDAIVAYVLAARSQ